MTQTMRERLIRAVNNRLASKGEVIESLSFNGGPPTSIGDLVDAILTELREPSPP